MIIASFVLALYPADAYIIVLWILIIMLLFNGVRRLFYYFTMARYKVGGITVFYKGMLMVDAGVFALTLDDLPRAYGMLYLIFMIVISGAIDVLQANQARRFEAGKWKYQFIYGAIKVAIGLSCFFFLNSIKGLTYIYCLGMLHSGISRIITSFRKTAIVYVN